MVQDHGLVDRMSTMRRLDQTTVRASLSEVFRLANRVEEWPRFLEHYRWVTVRDETPEYRLVEMAAWRPFGLFKYPTWWLSEMRVDENEGSIRYRHVDGITRGMDVEWRLRHARDGVEASIVHEWEGPKWPLIRRPAAEWVIGPIFIHGIASRTLAGIKREAESK